MRHTKSARRAEQRIRELDAAQVPVGMQLASHSGGKARSGESAVQR
jgi:hypothetical protein